MATTRSQDQAGNGNGHRRQDSDPIEGEAVGLEEHLIAGMPASELLDSALQFLRGNGRGVALTAVYLARRYPVPMMLAGLGYLAWRMASRRSEGVQSPARAGGALARSRARAVRQRFYEGAHAAQDRVSAARERAAERVAELQGQAADRAAELRERAAERAAELRERTRERAIQGRDALTQTMSDHPLAIGVAALAVGVLAGALLRRDRGETEDAGGMAKEMPDDDAGGSETDASPLSKLL